MEGVLADALLDGGSRSGESGSGKEDGGEGKEVDLHVVERRARWGAVVEGLLGREGWRDEMERICLLLRSLETRAGDIRIVHMLPEFIDSWSVTSTKGGEAWSLQMQLISRVRKRARQLLDLSAPGA